MKYLEITRKDSYAKGEFIVRALFGAFYIGIPHGVAMMFVGIITGILGALSFWAILFTGKYPEKWFEMQVNYIKWNVRFGASMAHMIEGYPEIGLKGDHEAVKVDIPYPEEYNRGSIIIRALFGVFYVMIPHGFCLFFRMIGQGFVGVLASLSLLFKGVYPENLFKFTEGTFRWNIAVSTYMGFMSNDYPKFNGAQE